MVLADFTITIESDPPRAVQVVVYDSLKGLRIAASRYDNRTRSRRRRKRGDYAHTLGVCHRFQQGTIEDGEFIEEPLCAIVRLAEPHLGVGLVSHEVTHAAVWINALDTGEDPAPLTCENDEPFVWLVGELVRQAINGMTERGVYEES